MKVIEELAHYLLNSGLISDEEHERVIEMTRGPREPEYHGHDDFGTDDDPSEWEDDWYQVEQPLEARDLRRRGRHVNGQFRKPRLKARRAASRKPHPRQRLSIEGLSARVAVRAPSWRSTIQAARTIGRTVRGVRGLPDPPRTVSGPPFPVEIEQLVKADLSVVRQAVELGMADGSLTAISLVRYLAFDGHRRLVDSRCDTGKLARRWIALCDTSAGVQWPKGEGAAVTTPWVTWAVALVIGQSRVFSACNQVNSRGEES